MSRIIREAKPTDMIAIIWMTWLLTKENPKSMVLDHPSEAGFYIID